MVLQLEACFFQREYLLSSEIGSNFDWPYNRNFWPIHNKWLLTFLHAPVDIINAEPEFRSCQATGVKILLLSGISRGRCAPSSLRDLSVALRTSLCMKCLTFLPGSVWKASNVPLGWIALRFLNGRGVLYTTRWIQKSLLDPHPYWPIPHRRNGIIDLIKAVKVMGWTKRKIKLPLHRAKKLCSLKSLLLR